ncbi:SRPBCC family protein [Nocardioides sp.]|uniref:SRPBCC family protein n=1 Tax=Nocardioides sp. TaxID=35761 RepID=UPI002734F826|nr:SRPBCC family protein [Nocardioides sp.]MDP3894078.1 hypothetical protein [Nocardioides sp.]
MGFTVEVDFGQPVSLVFGLLADPRRRPEWQSSLRRVEMLTPGEPGVGTRWHDVTAIGVRPLMEITTWETDRVWAERGSWRGLELTLDLRFASLDAATRTRVTATVVTNAPGWRRPIGWGLSAMGPLAAKDDLRRAARLLR